MNYLDYEGLLRYHELMDAKKQDTINSSHKLSADLVDDTSTTNKFVTANDKQTWNEKQDALTFNTTPSSSNKVATMADIPANTDTTYTLAAGNGDDANKIVLTPSNGSALKVTVPYASNAGTASNISGTVAITNGGTGATTASDARTNLGLGTLATKNSVSASDVGLGNVTNESKATMFTDAALTGTPTAPTATAGTNTTQIATTAFVKSAVDTATAGLTGAMHFKGTKESLPSTTTGYSDGDVILVETKEYVANGNSWVILGDESSFALKTTTVTGTGVLSGGGALSSNQTITHNTSGATAGSYGSVSGNSVNIPLITVDSYGHITAATNTGVTIPSIPDLSKSDSGSGNVVTSISVSGHGITVTKGATALLSGDIGSISYGTVGSSTLDNSKDIDKLFIS